MSIPHLLDATVETTRAFNNVQDVLGRMDVRVFRAVEQIMANELAMRPIDSLESETFRVYAKEALDIVRARCRAAFHAVSASTRDGERQYLLTSGLFGRIGREGNVAARFNTPDGAIAAGRMALNRQPSSYVVAEQNDYLEQFK